jgi:benzoate/toluate 1,2-dioxygenase beta subunit
MPDTLLRAVEAFLYREARLLDERAFEAWLALYAADCEYWIPARWGQVSAVDEVSIARDDHMTLQTRIGRLLHPRAHAQLPPSRTVHIVTNIRIVAEEGALLTVQSAFQFHEFRAPDLTQIVGLQEHVLRRHGDDFLILRKRMDLLQCDQALRSLQIPI